MEKEKAIVVQQQQQPDLLSTTDPDEMITQATEIAKVLARVIEDNHLYTLIKPKKPGGKPRRHVNVEGWVTLGSMVKVFPVPVYSHRLENRPEEIIYESKVEARTLDGQVVGAGIALCSSKEQNWQYKDEYAIESMSQTRATSKALRMPLGWIMTLGTGFESTPAEEIYETQELEITEEEILAFLDEIIGELYRAGVVLDEARVWKECHEKIPKDQKKFRDMVKKELRGIDWRAEYLSRQGKGGGN